MRLQHCEQRKDCQLVDGVHTPTNPVIAEQFPDWPPTQHEARRAIPDSEFTRRLDAVEERLVQLELSVPSDLAGWMNDCVNGYLKLLDRVQALETHLRILAAGKTP